MLVAMLALAGLWTLCVVTSVLIGARRAAAQESSHVQGDSRVGDDSEAPGDSAAGGESTRAASAAVQETELEGWRAPEEARSIENPLAPDEETLAAAAKRFRMACVNCHGATGAGDGRSARFFDVKPADLRERVPLQSDGELYWKITHGKQPMPSFAKGMSDEERWGIVHYLRTLVPSDDAAGEDPAPPGDDDRGSDRKD